MPLRTQIAGLRRKWSELALTTRFSAVSALIILTGMLTVGEWVARRIEDGVISDHAASAALFTNAVVKLQIQELATQSSLSNEARDYLDALLGTSSLARSIVGFRIWKGDTIVYSERSDLVGKTFLRSSARERAFSGEVVADYRIAGVSPSAPKAPLGTWLLEVYAPVRESGTNRVIALAETYEIAHALRADINNARVGSWLLISLIGLGMLGLQSAIVHRGSLTIQSQRNALNQRIEELSTMLAENKSLRHANLAGEHASEMNERFLRRIGGDLHDGPLQLIGMAVLRIDALTGLLESGEREDVQEALDDVVAVRSALGESMTELRNIAAGLAIPEIEHQGLSQIITTVARRHESRGGLPVKCSIDHPLPDVRPVIKACIYRFLQEGLSNALQHAEGRGQSIRCHVHNNTLDVAVLDEGPGLPLSPGLEDDDSQGLRGLRDRIEALGGKFSIANRSEGGVRLAAEFTLVAPCSEEPIRHA